MADFALLALAVVAVVGVFVALRGEDDSDPADPAQSRRHAERSVVRGASAGRRDGSVRRIARVIRAAAR